MNVHVNGRNVYSQGRFKGGEGEWESTGKEIERWGMGEGLRFFRMWFRCFQEVEIFSNRVEIFSGGVKIFLGGVEIFL